MGLWLAVPHGLLSTRSSQSSSSWMTLLDLSRNNFGRLWQRSERGRRQRTCPAWSFPGSGTLVDSAEPEHWCPHECRAARRPWLLRTSWKQPWSLTHSPLTMEFYYENHFISLLMKAWKEERLKLCLYLFQLFISKRVFSVHCLLLSKSIVLSHFILEKKNVKFVFW